MSTAEAAPEISVVIPARNEAANLAALIDEVRQALKGHSYEIVIVDDGSDDDTPALLAGLSAADPRIVHLRHPRSLGQSAGIQSGTRKAKGKHVVTLDGDGQNDPAYIPVLAERLADPAIGLVAGQRLGRKDSAAKRFASRIANGVRRTLLGDGTRDAGCGLKAYQRDAFLALPYFETMHRFLPALFLADGWRVDLVDVVDRPRRHGASKYGNLDRLLVGIPDLFGVAWLTRRRRKSARTILARDESDSSR